MLRNLAFPALRVLVLAFAVNQAQAESTCYGTTENGYLEGGVKLPATGPNFSAYGRIPATLGRTYVHTTVRSVVLDAYAELARLMPRTSFVYGETGRKGGGRFKPHRTHQNGLSVDFMVPVVNEQGASIPMPTSPLNRWGYDLEFGADGRAGNLRIDFEAIGAHLVALHRAATDHGVGLWRVIFAPDLQPRLYATSSGRYIRRHIRIPTKRSWVRHDDHYHVDFAIACVSVIEQDDPADVPLASLASRS